MLDAVSMYSDELTEAILEGNVTEDLIHAAVRKGTLSRELTPVFMGSAYKNKGVQLLLDAVVRYLPNPLDVENTAVDLSADEAPIVLPSDPNKPLVALAFKLEEGRYGQLTYTRIYQGTLAKGGNIENMRSGRRHKVGRLVRMHADSMEDIETACAGDIVALFGIDCASGDTFTDGTINVAMSSMHVPAPVVSIAIKAKDNKAQDNLAKALGRFVREDPTFRTHVDPESNETVISGMGELHLDVYVERMKREYKVEVTTGAPQVAYRETISQRADFSYAHKKQTGGSGQYGKVAGYIEPLPEGDDRVWEFVNDVRGGAIPTEFMGAVEKGFASALEKGRLIGFPTIGVRVVVNDGQSHAVDSSEMAFISAARGAFRSCYGAAKPIILEPVMKLVVEGPAEFQGAALKTVMQRRGTVIGTTEEAGFCRVEAEVPLAEMFGYATDLRSQTQGKAEFTHGIRALPAVPERGHQGAAREVRRPAQDRGRVMYRRFLTARSPLRLLEKGLHGGLGQGNLGLVHRRAGRRQDLLPGRRRARRAAAQQAGPARRARSQRPARPRLLRHRLRRTREHDASSSENHIAVRAEIDRLRRIRVYPHGSFDAKRLREALALEGELGPRPELVVVDGLDVAQRTPARDRGVGERGARDGRRGLDGRDRRERAHSDAARRAAGRSSAASA